MDNNQQPVIKENEEQNVADNYNTTAEKVIEQQETEDRQTGESEAAKYNPHTENTPKKKSIKKPLIVLISALVVIAILSTVYFFGNNFGNTNSTPDTTINEKTGAKLTASQVYEKVAPYVVGISITDNSGNIYYASGVAYDKGYIASAAHILPEKDKIKTCIIIVNDGSTYNGQYIASDTRSDVAIFKTAVDLTAATLGDSDKCVAGETVYVIGASVDVYEKPAITNGIISLPSTRISLSKNSYADKIIQINAAIMNHSIGGAVCNEYGQVIGIALADLTSSGYNDLSYVIPSRTLKSVADALIKDGVVTERAVLGITYSEIDKETAKETGYIQGLRIGSVREESDLNGKAKEGDTIVAVNGNTITSANVLLDVIEQSKPGDEIELTIADKDGKQNKVKVKLISDKDLKIDQTKDNSSDITLLPNDDNSSDPSTFNFPYGN